MGFGLGLEGVGETLDNQWILCVKGVRLKSLGLDLGDRLGSGLISQNHVKVREFRRAMVRLL